MMDKRMIPFVVLGVIFAIWNLAAFRVPQWRQAVVVQLGEPVRIVRDPGLYWKIPFVQNVMMFDRRLLEYDASPRELLTKDKQQLVVDNFARWRILDPLQFYRTVRDEEGARSRLDDIIYSNVRENLGRHRFSEIINEKRSMLMAEVTKATDAKAREFGIEVMDVRIKRADLPEQNSKNIFDRMRAERQREAAEFRAEGAAQGNRIRADADRQVTIIKADATREGERTRGEGDAERNRIFADAFGRDPDFFGFYRSMQAYEQGIKSSDTRMLLTPEGEFFRYFNNPSGNNANGAQPKK
jgi:membrane protease subunit HflC